MRELARVPLGRSGLTARPIGLGTARLGAFWQGRTIPEGRDALAAALDGGIDLIDTADCYARGISERLVGRAVRGRDACVMTKVGLVKTPAALAAAVRFQPGSLAPRLRGLTPGPTTSSCFSAAYVRAAAHACLRRQRVSQLDILLLHEPTEPDLREGRFQPALESLTVRGDITAWGASVRTLAAARAALALPGLSVLQIPVSGLDTRVVDAVRASARAAGVALVAIAALENGRLLARAQTVRPQQARAELVAALTRAALAIEGIDAVLVGMSSADHVHGLLAAEAASDSDAALLAELRGQ